MPSSNEAVSRIFQTRVGVLSPEAEVDDEQHDPVTVVEMVPVDEADDFEPVDEADDFEPVDEPA